MIECLTSELQGVRNLMNYVTYIVYGDNDGYFIGARFSILTLLAHNASVVQVIILTDRPSFFSDLPATVLDLSVAQQRQWSLDGRYHFRIKNRGLAFVLEALNLDDSDKIIAVDTDAYFVSRISELFERMNPTSSTIFKNEGTIRKKKRFKVFKDALDGKTFKIAPNKVYRLSPNAEMWGTLLWGFQVSNKTLLNAADDIMLCLLDIVDAHTIEPFALTEAIKADHDLFESRQYVKNYSTSGKKRYALGVLRAFFDDFGDAPIEKQIEASKRVNLSRNFFQLIKSRYERYTQ